MRIPPVLIARHLCDLLPSQVQTRVLGDRVFVSQYGRLSRSVVTVGRSVSIDQQDLFAGARHVLAGESYQSLKDISGRPLLVTSNQDSVALKEMGQSDQDILASLPDLIVLSPTREQRTRGLKRMIESFGPTARDFSALQIAAEDRELTNEEVADLLDERSTGFAAQRARIVMAHEGNQINVNDIVPDSLRYYEQFCGPDPAALLPEEYLTGALPKYRRLLLQGDVVRGLEICLLGALRDDLMPGAWTSDISDDDMWYALEAIDARANPFMALGLLDIAITRPHDNRYKTLASETMIELGKEKLLRPDGVDTYEILPLFAELVLERINMLEGGALRNPFWKRLCAWMHAGLLVQSTLNISIDLDALRRWVRENRVMAGTYAQMVDLHREPMYRAGEFTRSFLREEIIGRLVALRARHQAAGLLVPGSEDIDAAMARLTREGSPLGWAMPGPLDGHIRPAGRSRSLSGVDIAYVIQELSKDPSGPIWSKLAYFSQCFDLGEEVLARACEVSVTAGEKERSTRLFDMGVIAAAHRNKDLAHSIAATAIKRAPLASNANAAMSILQIILLASATFENEKEWSSWTRDQLVRLAYNLPAGEASETLRDHLAEIKTVLPISSAITSSAEAIAAAAN